jgi:hypothetical protein
VSDSDSKVSTGLGLGAIAASLTSFLGAAAGGPDFAAVAERIGVPVTVLLFVGFALSKTGAWLATKVVEPLVGAVKGFVTTVAEETKKHTTTLEVMRVEAAEDRKTAAADRASAAEDRRTHRMDLESLRALIEGRAREPR